MSSMAIRRILPQIRADLEASRLSDAQAGLVALWGPTRDPRVRELISRIDRVVGPFRPQLRPGGRVSDTAWLRREAGGHPADVPLLLATLTLVPGRPGLRTRLQRLAQRAPDPRVYADLVGRLPRRDPRDPTYTPALVRHADPHGPRPVGVALPPRVVSALEAPTHPLSDDEAETLASAVAQATGGRRKRVWTRLRPPAPDPWRETLWRAVVETPDDDGPRHVYSDHLAETDPDLARFVQLQLAAESRALSSAEAAHVRRVLRERLGDLLGPLAPSVLAKGVELRRGFLHAGTVLTSPGGARNLGDDFRWRTARALTCGYGAFYEGEAVAGLHEAGTRFVRRSLPSSETAWVLRRGGEFLKAGPLRQLAMRGVAPSWRALQIKQGLFDDTWAGLSLPELETLVFEGEHYTPNGRWPALRELVLRYGPNADVRHERDRLVSRVTEDAPHIARLAQLERLVLVTFQDLQLVFDATSPGGRIVSTNPTGPPVDRDGDGVVELLHRIATALAAAQIRF